MSNSHGNTQSDNNPMQLHDWAGEMGEKWNHYHTQFEGMIAPVGRAALDAAGLKPGHRVLDIGCGAGATTLEIARRVAPDGAALGVDVAPVLIETSRRRAAADGLINARFLCADAGQQDIGVHDFDVLFSRFGVMFFNDPVAAFTNLHRFLRPDARLAMACWGPPQRNGWVGMLMEIVSRHVTLPPPVPRAPGPFQLAESDFTIDVLSRAGFRDIEFAPWEGQQLIGGPGLDAAGAARFVMNALFVGEALQGQSDDVRSSVLRQVEALFAAHRVNEGVSLPAMAWIITGCA
ncbi:MAG: class I SAM-dependent methyltransferase [Gammaproteobacteria bacterium]|nr:class I SAM-dependent methyltransferase [Gammaproteobacteria bacterium]